MPGLPRSADDGAAPQRSALRRVDDALVPALQGAAHRVGRLVGWPARALRRLDGWVAGGRVATRVHRHRGLVALVVISIVFAAAVVNLERYPELRARQQQDAAAAGSGDGTSVPDDTTGGPELGPLVGAQVDPYLQARREALAAAPADEERWAVVSFDEFVTPRAAQEAIGDLQVHSLEYQLPERTPTPSREPVDGNLVATMDGFIEEFVGDLQQEEADVSSTLETTEDPDFRADFEARLDELVALRNTLTNDPRIVFAVTVQGDVSRLQEIAGAEQVRLVDLLSFEEGPVALDRAHGILPTDQERFSHGRRTAG